MYNNKMQEAINMSCFSSCYVHPPGPNIGKHLFTAAFYFEALTSIQLAYFSHNHLIKLYINGYRLAVTPVVPFISYPHKCHTAIFSNLYRRWSTCSAFQYCKSRTIWKFSWTNKKRSILIASSSCSASRAAKYWSRSAHLQRCNFVTREASLEHNPKHLAE